MNYIACFLRLLKWFFSNLLYQLQYFWRDRDGVFGKAFVLLFLRAMPNFDPSQKAIIQVEHPSPSDLFLVDVQSSEFPSLLWIQQFGIVHHRETQSLESSLLGIAQRALSCVRGSSTFIISFLPLVLPFGNIPLPSLFFGANRLNNASSDWVDSWSLN